MNETNKATNHELVAAAIKSHKDWLIQQKGVTGFDQCLDADRVALRIFHGQLDDETKAEIEARVAPAPVVWQYLPEINAY